jgi:hypothetical protein
MKYMSKAIGLFLCILVSANSLYSQNEQERKRKNAEKLPNNAVLIDRQSIVVDRNLLDVYVRMMRYQTAWQDAVNLANDNETTPDDYLTIAVRNVQEGSLKDLSNYLKSIRTPANDVLSIDRQTKCGIAVEGGCGLAYEAKWAKEGAQYGLKFKMPNTGNVDHYITYDVTVDYKGKSVTHGGVIVHYRNKNAGFMIYDGVIPQIDDLVLDKMPLMEEPRRQVRAFSGTRPKAKVRELKPDRIWSSIIEEDDVAPIGWLPNDDMELEDDWESGGIPVMMMAAGVQVVINDPGFTAPWGTKWGAVDPVLLAVDVTAVENCNTNTWEPMVIAVSLTIRKYAQLLSGCVEASVNNVNQFNYCDMIQILSAPVNPNVLVPYYVLDAVKAHENRHVDQLREVFNNRLSNLEPALKGAASIPLSSASNAGAAAAIIKGSSAFASAVNQWYADRKSVV